MKVSTSPGSRTLSLSAVIAAIVLLSGCVETAVPEAPVSSAIDAALVGAWEGELVVGAQKLAMGVTVTANSVSIDVPAQNLKDFKASAVRVENGTVIADFSFKASLEMRAAAAGTIDGVWAQSGQRFPLPLARVRAAASGTPGSSSAAEAPGEQVRFASAQSGVTLAGTLRLPEGKGPFPCLVLMTGSGPQDRDETIMAIKPFKDIAEALAARGWATLRYDDRGTGQSGGSFAGSTSADFAQDAVGAYRFAAADSRIAACRVALGGHSEGGYVALLAENLLGGVYGLVLIAAPGVSGYDILMDQSADLLSTMGASASAIASAAEANKRVYDLILNSPQFPAALVESELRKAGMPADQAAAQMAGLSDPWFKAFLASEPSDALKVVRSPILAINGGKDLQVRADKNLGAIEAGARMAGVPVTTLKPEGLNHLFQKADTGLPQEYASLEPVFSPAVIDAIADWLDRLPR